MVPQTCLDDARNPNTPAERLQQRWDESGQDIAVARAIGRNPNVAPALAREIFTVYPSLIAENPAALLFLLEDVYFWASFSDSVLLSALHHPNLPAALATAWIVHDSRRVRVAAYWHVNRHVAIPVADFPITFARLLSPHTAPHWQPMPRDRQPGTALSVLFWRRFPVLPEELYDTSRFLFDPMGALHPGTTTPHLQELTKSINALVQAAARFRLAYPQSWEAQLRRVLTQVP